MGISRAEFIQKRSFLHGTGWVLLLVLAISASVELGGASKARASLEGDSITAEVVWETVPVDWPPGFNVLIAAGTPATVHLAAGMPEYSVPFFSLGGSRFEIDLFDGPPVGGSTNGLLVHVDFADFSAWPIPATFRVTLSDLDWTPEAGRIVDVFKVGGESGVLEVISFTDDSITLEMSSRIVIGGTGFDVEYRYDVSHEPITTLGPFTVSNVFETPDCFFQEGCTAADFPVDWGVLRTFDYSSELAGRQVADVLIQGTWGGNFGFGGTAPVEIYLEGILVAECLIFQPCWDNASTVDWNGGAGFLLSDLGVDFSDPAVRALFEDGSAELSAIQNDLTSVNLSNLSLQVEALPEPGRVMGLGSAILLLLGLRRLRSRR